MSGITGTLASGQSINGKVGAAAIRYVNDADLYPAIAAYLAEQGVTGATPEQIAAAVEAYLAENPVSAPVDSVNGKTGAVELTAADVGALSQDALQTGVDAALAQASESGAFDGEDGGYYTPSVDAEGNLSWTASKADMPTVAGANIKGPPGDAIDVDATLTQAGQAADAAAVGEQLSALSEEIANLPGASGSGAGWSTEEIALLEIILGKAVYSTDQTNNIAALIALLKSNSSGSEGSGGSSGGDSGGANYTVTLNLDGVTPSNVTQVVASGGVYVNQLSVADGYVLGSVTVMMGGFDVTSNYYDGDGNITIPSVTGNIEINCKALIAETLNIVSLGTNWPDPATFEYTAATIWTQLVLAEESETTGGYVDASWDTESITGGPAVRLYLFKNGEPYKRGGNTNGNGDAIDGINGNWDEPGSSNYFGNIATTEPFRVQIPDGCTVMVALQRGTLASDAITSNGTFATWARDGGLTVMKVEGE